MPPADAWIMSGSADDLVVRNAARAAEQLGLRFSVGTGGHGDPPVVVILDLEEEGAIEAVATTKQRWPLTMVVGVLVQPSSDLWARAEDHGCDVVTSRGALRRALITRVPGWMESPGGRRLRLFSVDDIAGRLGLVHRLDDSPVGPVAVYHMAGEVLAVEDRCPHAGARLSGGSVNVDDGVVTCPEHGSRFDTRSGARVRGPSDEPIRTHRVVIEDGTAYLEIP